MLINHSSGQALPWHQQQWSTMNQQLFEDHLHHAYLLHGAKGLAKSEFAQQFAQQLLCETKGDLPCGQCRHCQLYQHTNHPDCLLIQPEQAGKAIGVDAIRASQDFVNTTPQLAKRKVLLILAADKLNRHGANALLKNLEEPNGRVVMLLVTSHMHLLLPTIRSRCQLLAFKPSYEAATLQWLQGQGACGADMQSLLKQSEGAPYQALALAADDEVARSSQLFGQISELMHGRLSPVAMAEKWHTQCDSGFLSTLVSWLADCIRLQMTHNKEQIVHKSLINDFTLLINKLPLNELFQLQNKLQQFHHLIITNSHINLQLQLESLFIDWPQVKQ